MPITWQNIRVPSLGDPSRSLQLAQLGIGGAFDKLSDIASNIGERQDATKVQAFMDRLQQAKSPKEVAELQASGELDALRAGIKNPQNLAAIRGAADARTAGTMQQIAAGQAFNNQQTDLAQQPIMDQVTAAYARGDYASGDALITANPSLRNQALLAKERFVGEKTRTDLVQGTAKFKDELLSSASKRTAEASNAAANTVNANASASNSQTNARNTDAQVLERQSATLAATATRLSEMNKGVIGGQDGFNTLITNLSKTIGDKDKLEATTGLITRALASNPKFNSLPTSAVETIALKHIKEIGTGIFSAIVDPLSGNMVKAMTADMDKALEANAGKVSNSEAARSLLTTQLKQQQLVLDEAQKRVYPELQAQIDSRAAQVPTAPVVAPAVQTAPVSTVPVVAPTPPETKAPTQLARQAALEQDEISVGTRKDFTTEVKKYMDTKEGQKQVDSVAAKNELQARADAIQANQQEAFRKRLGQVSTGISGGTAPGAFQASDAGKLEATIRRRAEFDKEATKKAK